MKKTLIRLGCLCICLAMTLSMVACGGSASSDEAASGSEVAIEDNSELYSSHLEESGLMKDVNISELVTLGEYKGLTVPAESWAVTEDEVTADVDYILSQYGSYEQITDRAVADGDYVNIDYVGSVDGEEFSGGNTNGAGTMVTAGSTEYIDDFLTQIIGHKPGETIDVEVTFPEPYENNPDLAGKDAVFVTTINYIQGDWIVPELTDDFVKENLTPYESAQELKDAIRTSLEDTKAENYVLNAAFENATFNGELPQAQLDALIAMDTEYLEMEIAQYVMYGIDRDTYIQMSGYASEEAMMEAIAANSELNLKTQLVFQAVAEAEGIEVTDEAIENYFTEFAPTVDPAEAETYYGRGYVAQAVLMNLSMDLVAESAVRE
ncbi:MAG: FKBP-type peptidyl-prolyl cis-trans isomerase [Oscillospiraceae bacterium]|nr:FKBP-type peptidyl-prolyl cis-trans isomerase [Oscillospiraceae bacterium]